MIDALSDRFNFFFEFEFLAFHRRQPCWVHGRPLGLIFDDQVEIPMPGVVEHGLFIDMAHCAVIGSADGATEVLYRPGARGADPVDVVELMRNQDA